MNLWRSSPQPPALLSNEPGHLRVVQNTARIRNAATLLSKSTRPCTGSYRLEAFSQLRLDQKSTILLRMPFSAMGEARPATRQKAEATETYTTSTRTQYDSFDMIHFHCDSLAHTAPNMPSHGSPEGGSEALSPSLHRRASFPQFIWAEEAPGHPWRLSSIACMSSGSVAIIVMSSAYHREERRETRDSYPPSSA